MNRPSFSTPSAVWLWRVSLILVILAISLIRHLNVLSVMWVYVVWFGSGLVLGILVDILDKRVLLKKYQDPQATSTQPVTSSLLFYLSLIPLSLFVITSSGSALGAGLILGLWVAVLSDFVTAPNSDFIRLNYLYQLKRPLTDVQTTWLIRGGFFWLLLLTILAMF